MNYDAISNVAVNVLRQAIKEENNLLTLNPYDEDHKKIVLELFSGDDGMHPHFPTMEEWLKRCKKVERKTLKEYSGATQGWVDSIFIKSFGIRQGQICANGVVSLVDAPVFLQSGLIFVDKSTEKVVKTYVLPKTFDKKYQNISFSIEQENMDICVLLAAVWLPEGEDNLVMKMHVVSQERKESVDYISKLEVENPRQLPEHSAVDHILIALYRTPEAPDTDYDYLFNFGKVGGNPYWAIPMSGWAKLAQNVSFAGDTQSKSYVAFTKREGGGSRVFEDVAMDFVISKETGIVKWELQPNLGDGFPWGEHVECDYEFGLFFPVLVDGIQDTAYIRVSDFPSVPNNALSNEGITKYIKYAWGCLAADTLVTMADGSRRKISNIHIGECVSGPDGKICYIENIWQGYEQNLLVRIETESGYFLSMTEQHPVMLDGNKPVRAKELQVNDVVVTENGEEKIVSITREKTDELVWNLDLKEGNTFYAGNILVGDNRMQNNI